MTRILKLLLVAALALLPFGIPLEVAHAAATTQTTHAFLCSPAPSVGTAGPRRVVNPQVASPVTAYNLNQDGCAVIAAADIGYFLSQGYYYGPNIFTQTQTGILANQTSSTSNLVLPAYGVIMAVILEETAGNAVTGGVSIGDSGSASRFATGVALGANATVAIVDSALTRLFSNSGVPSADQMLVTCVSTCNSASINVTVLYSYY